MPFTAVRAADSKLNLEISLISRVSLIALVISGATLFGLVTDANAQHMARQSGVVTLVVQPQIDLQEHGPELVLKVRLAQGTSVKLWESSSCSFPRDDGKTFTASGTYTVPLQDFSAEGEQAYACAVSSDGLLRASIPLQNGSLP